MVDSIHLPARPIFVTSSLVPADGRQLFASLNVIKSSATGDVASCGLETCPSDLLRRVVWRCFDVLPRAMLDLEYSADPSELPGWRTYQDASD